MYSFGPVFGKRPYRTHQICRRKLRPEDGARAQGRYFFLCNEDQKSVGPTVPDPIRFGYAKGHRDRLVIDQWGRHRVREFDRRR